MNQAADSDEIHPCRELFRRGVVAVVDAREAVVLH